MGDRDMFADDILFALVMAFIFTMVFAVGLQRPGPWSSVLTFFLIIFLVAWAGSLWINPAGPVLFGVFWLPLILVSFVAVVLLATATPKRPSRVETISQVKEDEQVVRRVFDLMFWTVLIAFAIIILLGYVVRIPAA